jgi:transcriptional antiterminator RfaH
MAYWAVAQLQPQRERLAVHCLRLEGYETYFPRLRQVRRHNGRKIESSPPLFPGYAFVLIELQWSRCAWAPGVASLIMNGTGPARVPNSVISEIQSRERNGLIELPSRLQPGDRVRLLYGPFAGHIGLYAGMKPRERIEVLLAILGSAQRVTLAKDAVEAV